MPKERPKRILVVDDNLPLRVLLSHALEEAGYVAIAAESGEAALEVASFDPPDLCLIDHHMPGMDGAALIRALRGSPDARLRAIPAIGLTGYEPAARDLLEAGAVFALQKPCGEGPLLEKVACALRGAKA
jgi:two-component system, OmpR family, phosphate regulon response regulator PhoB